jgi:hypothetical protein
MSNQDKLKIVRSGQWPLFKYTIRSDRVGYCTVFIDDNCGDILINPGDQIAFKHWWGKDGRGTDKLRQFLTTASRGYIEDKFSYGLSRWCQEAALDSLEERLGELHGHPEMWPYGAHDAIEDARGCGLSPDGLYLALSECDAIAEIFHSGEPPHGELSANKDVTRFIEEAWGPLVQLWKAELLEEGELPYATP